MKNRITNLAILFIVFLTFFGSLSVSTVQAQTSTEHYLSPVYGLNSSIDVPNSDPLNNNTASNMQASNIFIMNPNTEAVTVDIFIGGVQQNVTIAAESSITRDLTSYGGGNTAASQMEIIAPRGSDPTTGLIQQSGAVLNNKGVRVISQSLPVIVSFRYSTSAHAGHLVSKGLQGLGSEFVVGGVVNRAEGDQDFFDTVDVTQNATTAATIDMSNLIDGIRTYGLANGGTTTENLATPSYNYGTMEDDFEISLLETLNVRSAFVSFMATDPGTTTVTVELNRVGNFNNIETGVGVTGTSANGRPMVTYTLSQYQTVTLVEKSNFDDNSGNNLLGAKITTNSIDQRISVNVGNSIFLTDFFPVRVGDLGIDQISPTELTGTDYIISRGQGDDNLELAVVVAQSNNTSIFINGQNTPYATLQAGDWVLIDNPNSALVVDAASGNTINLVNSGINPYHTNIFEQAANAERGDTSQTRASVLSSLNTTNAPTGNVTPYTAQDNMYIRTSRDAYVYQIIAATTGAATTGVFFVPPLVCNAPRTAQIPNLNVGGARTDFSPALNILVRSDVDLFTINGVPLENLINTNQLLNYPEFGDIPNGMGGTTFSVLVTESIAINSVNGRPVEGLIENFVTYKLVDNPNIAGNPLQDGDGNLFVVSDSDLYVAGYGFRSNAAQGGYYAGFPLEYEITTDDTCFPLTLEGPEGFDEYQWFRNGAPISALDNPDANSATITVSETDVSQTHFYFLEANFIGCDPISSSNIISGVAVPQPSASTLEAAYCNLDFLIPTADEYPDFEKLEGDTVLGIPQGFGGNLSANIEWYEEDPTVVIPGADAMNPNNAIVGAAKTTTPIASTVGEHTYYAVYRPPSDPCFSAVPLEITVTITGPTDAPTYTNMTSGDGVNSIVFCATNQPTIQDLTNSGIVTPETDTSVIWFTQDYIMGDTSAENVNPFSPISLLQEGVYWSASFNNGTCDYTNRTPVQVYVEGPLTFDAEPQNTTICANTDVVLTTTVRNNGSSSDDIDAIEIANDSMGIFDVTGADANVNNSGNYVEASGDIQYVWQYQDWSTPTSNGAWIDIPMAGIVTQVDADEKATVSTSTITLTSNFIEDNQLDSDTNNSGGAVGYRVLSTIADDGTPTTPTCAPDVDFPSNSYLTSSAAFINFTGFIDGSANTGNAIRIDTPPVDGQTACGGDIITLSVEATVPGGTLQYEWQQRTRDITGDNDGNGTPNEPTDEEFGWNTVGSNRNLLVTASTGLNGEEFRVVITTELCEGTNSIASTPVEILVEGPVTITQNIASQTVCSGTDVTFEVAADFGTVTGITEIYSWFVDEGTGFRAITAADVPQVPDGSGGMMDGPIDEATITIENVEMGDNGNRYQARVSTTECNSPISSTAFLTVEGPVVASTVDIEDSIDPNDGTATQDEVALICNGGILTLSAVPDTSYEGTPVYTWQRSDTNTAPTVFSDLTSNIVGTGQTLLLSNIQANNNGFGYRVLTGTGECSTTTASASDAITLNVSGPLFITQEIGNQVVCADEALELSISVNQGFVSSPDTDLQYEWTKQLPGTSIFVPVTYSETVDDDMDGDGDNDGNPAFGTTPSMPGDPVISTNPMLSLTNAALTTNGNSTLYRVEVSNTVCSSPASSTALVTLEGPLTFTPNAMDAANDALQPSFDASYCVGEVPILTYNAYNPNSGTVTYTLSRKANATATPVILDSGTGTTFVLPSPVTQSDNGFIYSIEATTGACDTAVVSNEITLNVEGPLEIDVDVTDQVTCQETTGSTASASFTVTASATNGTIAYQWQRSTNGGGTFVDLTNTTLADDTVVTGATTATLNLTMLEAADNHLDQFRVLLSTGQCDEIESSVGILNIEGPVAINTQPMNVNTCPGSSISFSVGVNTGPAGVSPVIDWFYSPDGITYSELGISGTTLTLLNVLSGNAGFYRAEVSTDNCSTVLVSDAAELTLDGAVVVTENLDDVTVCAVEDPMNAGVYQAPSPVFTINATASSFAWTKSTDGTNFTPVLASETTDGVINTNTLSLNPIDEADIATMNGTFYQVDLTAGGCSGAGAVAVAQLFIDGPLRFATGGTPSSQTVCAGDTAIFTASADALTGSGNLDYFWEVDFGSGFIAAPGGSNASLVLSGVTATQNGATYRVTISTGIDSADGGCGTLTYPDDFAGAADVVLNVEGPIAITQGLEDRVVCQETMGTAVPAAFSVTSTAGSGTQIYDWERFDTGTNTWVDIDVATETVDGDNDGNNDFDNGDAMAATTDITTASTLNLSVTAANDNTLYRVRITTAECTTEVISQAQLDVEGPITITPAFTAGIEDVAVCDGNSLILSVDASIASGSLTYLWEESDTSGANFATVGTSPVFTKSNVSAALDSGRQYRITVGSSEGNCTEISKTYELYVDGPIVITEALEPQTVCDDDNAASNETAIFEAKATAGPNGSIPIFKWFDDDNNELSTSGIYTIVTAPAEPAANEEVTSTLTITGNLDAATFDGDVYRVEITTVLPDATPMDNTDNTVGPCPVTSSSAILTVEGPISNFTVVSQNSPTIVNTTTMEDELAVCTDEVVVLVASSDNSSTSYLWERSNNPDFLNAGEPMADATDERSIVASGPVYTFDATPSLTNMYYRAVASVSATCQLQSDGIKLIVDGPINIINPIDSITICTVEDVTFEVEATIGNGNLQYQWVFVQPGDTMEQAIASIGYTIDVTTPNILIIEEADSGLNGYEIRVNVTSDITDFSGNQICPTQTSSATIAQGGITGTFSIAEGDANDDIFICASDNLFLSIDGNITDTNGNIVTDFVWQSSNNAGFSETGNTPTGEPNEVNTVGSGVTFGMNNVQASSTGTYFRALARAGICANIPSQVVQLTVDGPLEITTPLVDANICDMDDGTGVATFTVTAETTNGIPQFEWLDDNGMAITDGDTATIGTDMVTYAIANNPLVSAAGVNTSTLTLTGVTSAFNGFEYTVNVTTDINDIDGNNVCPEVTSTAALNIEGPLTDIVYTTTPAIDDNGTAADVSDDFIAVCFGGVVSLQAETTTSNGDAIAYTWETSDIRDFDDPAATVRIVAFGPTYNITNASEDINGTYFRVVANTNLCSSASDPIEIRLDGPIAYTRNPSDQLLCQTDVGVSISTTFIAETTSINGGSTSFQWFVEDANGNITPIDTALSTTTGFVLDGITYTQTSVNTTDPTNDHPTPFRRTSSILNLNGVTFDNDGLIYFTESVTTVGACSAEMSTRATLNVEGPIGDLTVVSDPAATAGMANVCVGDVVTFTANAANPSGGPLNYTWQYNATDNTFPDDATTVNIANSAIFTISSASTNSNGYYQVVVSTDSAVDCNVTSDPIQITVQGPLDIVQEVIDANVCDNGDPTTQVATFTAIGAISNGTPTIIWQDPSGTVIVDATTVGDFTYDIVEDTASVAGQITSVLSITGITYANSNTDQYTAVIGSVSSACTPILSTGRVLVDGPISDLVVIPSTLDVCVGDTATLEVDASVPNGSNITYLWQSSTDNFADPANTSIEGSGPVLTLSNITSNMGDLFYRAVATVGECSNIPSDVVQFNVDGAIVITDPIDDIGVCDDDSGTITATFTVVATTDNGDLIYTWYKGNTSTTPITDAETATGAVGSASGTSITVPVTTADNATIYRVEVSTDPMTGGGICDPEVSSALLTVDGPITLDVTTNPADDDADMDIETCVGDTVTFEVQGTTGNGAPINYIWESTDATDTNFDNASPAGSGPVLTIGSVTADLDQRLYRVLATSGGCSSIASDAIQLGRWCNIYRHTISRCRTL